MNPKRQKAGRKGGKAGRGAAKARLLDPRRASDMAWRRWHGKRKADAIYKAVKG